MGCPVRWGSASLPPGLALSLGFQQARGPPAVFARRAERYFGTGTEHRHVRCLLSSPWYEAPLLQSCSMVTPSAGSDEVLPILMPGSEGWRSRGWG